MTDEEKEHVVDFEMDIETYVDIPEQLVKPDDVIYVNPEPQQE